MPKNHEKQKPLYFDLKIMLFVCFLAIFIQITRIIRSFSRCYLMRGLFEALIRLGKGAIVLVGESQYLRENIS